ncbi:MAG: hypothetical protein ACR2MO_16385 [Acidimicrobiales bacterium]
MPPSPLPLLRARGGRDGAGAAGEAAGREHADSGADAGHGSHKAVVARLAAMFVGAGLLAGACSPAPAAPLPPSPAVVPVTMEEYRFGHPSTTTRGRAVFRVRNAGRSPHQLALVPLPEDFPPIAEQVAGSKRRFVEALARTRKVPPGQRTSFAVDLSPGRYALICFLADPDGVPHANKGMASELRVT